MDKEVFLGKAIEPLGRPIPQRRLTSNGSRLDRIENIARILDMAKEEKSIKRLTQPETPECYFLISYLVETGMLSEVNKRRKEIPKKKRGNYKTTSKGHKLLEKLRKLYSLIGWSLSE